MLECLGRRVMLGYNMWHNIHNVKMRSPEDEKKEDCQA
jgi:hypothetical protein